MGIQESLVERVMTTCIDAPYAQMPVELVSPTKEQLLDEIHRFQIIGSYFGVDSQLNFIKLSFCQDF